MLDKKDKKHFDLSGALLYDPCIGDCGLVQGDIPTTQFALNNQVILNLNQSILDDMVAVSATCGIDDVSSGRRSLQRHSNPGTANVRNVA